MSALALGLRLNAARGPRSLMARAISAIRRNNGTLIGIPDNALGDGAPNLLSSPEFAAGVADAPTRGGLITASALAGYDGAIAFGRDGVTTSYAYKTLLHTNGLTYVFSILCKMDDGAAPAFASTNDGTIGTNSFAIVIGGAVINPTLLTSQLQADGTYRVSGAWLSTGATNSMGVVKYTTNDNRTFKVTGYKLEVGSTATAYTPQSVLRQRGAYIDSAGTQPVTAVGDVLGLLTDRSYGAGNLGPEKVANGDFSAGTTGWAFPSGWALVSGAAAATSASSSLLQSGAPLVAGKSYQVEFDWTHASGTLYVRVGVGAAVTHTTSGRKSMVLVAANTAGIEFYGGAVSGSLDNISVREVLGNHATQPTTASKPTVTLVPKRTRGPVNQFVRSSDLTQSIWVKSGVTPTAGQADTLGGFTASRIVAAGGAYQYVYQTVSWAAGVASTLAIKVKSTTGANQFFRLAYGSGGGAYSPVLTATNQWQIFVLNFFSSSSDICAVVSDVNGATASPFDLVVERFGAFTGTYTAQQILDNGGIPLTTTQPLPNVLEWTNAISFDGSNDFLQTGITTGNEGWICAGVTFDNSSIQSLASTGAGSATEKGIFPVLVNTANGGPFVQAQVGNGTTRTQATSALLPTNTPAVVSMGWSPAGLVAGVNNTESAPVAFSGDVAGPFPMKIGVYRDGVTLPLKGPMPAQVYCAVYPSAADRALIRKWIGSLQGQTL